MWMNFDLTMERPLPEPTSSSGDQAVSTPVTEAQTAADSSPLKLLQMR